MRPDFELLYEGLDISELREQLLNPEVPWGCRNLRREDKYTESGEARQSPHVDMQDLWVRYNSFHRMHSASFNGEHTSEWYPEVAGIPAIAQLVAQVMILIGGERLGGVLITKLPPGGKIVRHVDCAWHSQYYNKYLVPIICEEGADFCWDSGVLRAKAGQLWRFENDTPHWVENNSQSDRIVVIISARPMFEGIAKDLTDRVPELDSKIRHESLEGYTDAQEMYKSPQIVLDKQLHSAGKLLAVEFNIPAGVSLGKHVHDYDHLSSLCRGSVKVELFHRDEETPYHTYVVSAKDGAKMLNICAHIYHKVTAIEEAQWFCIHSEDSLED